MAVPTPRDDGRRRKEGDDDVAVTALSPRSVAASGTTGSLPGPHGSHTCRSISSDSAGTCSSTLRPKGCEAVAFARLHARITSTSSSRASLAAMPLTLPPGASPLSPSQASHTVMKEMIRPVQTHTVSVRPSGRKIQRSTTIMNTHLGLLRWPTTVPCRVYGVT